MNAHKIQVKLFFRPDSAAPPLQAFIPVFHGWIAQHTLPELLIDVANYAHVPAGPGVVLIGHGSDYAIDEQQGRRGLLYSRKRQPPTPSARLGDAFRRAIHAALLLEQQSGTGHGAVRFGPDEWLVRVNDRLAAPNTAASFDAIAPVLQAFCGEVFQGDPCEVERVGDSRELFSVRIRNRGIANLPTLLGRLGGAPLADGAGQSAAAS